MRNVLLCSLFVLMSFSSPACGDDWPGWLGPGQESIWRERGIVKKFPDEGLPVKWRVPVQWGYSGPAVADGRVYVLDYVKTAGEIQNTPDGRNELQGQERILCFSAETGQELWKHAYDRPYRLSYAGGPRCTPTVDAGKVYALGAEGDLTCLDAEKGDVLWHKDLTKEYDTQTPIWGFSASPLVDGDLLFCLVGGEGSVAVAFNKHTGEEVWRALSAEPQGYCPPSIIEHAGTKQLLIWDPESLNSLNPLTGEVYWSEPLKPDYEMSITIPRKMGKYLFASAIRNTAKLLELRDDKPGVQVVWAGKPKNAVYCANSTPLLDDGMIYGADCNSGALTAARIEDGERLWETFAPTTGGDRRAGHGTAFLVRHEDRYFLFSETGDLILAKLSPAGYEELSRFHVLEPTNEAFKRKVVWSHPAFAEKCVFARNDQELVCVDLEEK